MTKKMNNKPSAKRKLLPAIGMLTVSAMMLSSSTYAWFTMSKEVEVKGINMTATVPENIQISLGDGQATGTLDATISSTAGATLNRLTAVTAPGNDDSDPDWSNSVVAGEFYTFGLLTPATSVDGLNVSYTLDSNGVGKSLKGQTVSGSTITGTVDNTQFQNASGLTAAAALQGDTLTDSYSKGGAYYVDIPVWFRTSASGTVNLAVKATVSKTTDATVGFTANTAGNRADDPQSEDLYKAVRVSVLKGDGTTAGGTANTGVQGVLVSDNWGKYYAETAEYHRPISGVGTYDIGTTAWAGIKKATPYTAANSDGYAPDGTALVTMSGSSTSGKNFGDAVRYTIRVWIDGEDENCWNATAGQNFTVALNFMRQASGVTGTAIATETVT